MNITSFRLPLRQYLSEKKISQGELAKRANLSQGAISKMLRTGRNIVVVEIYAGNEVNIHLVEEKIISRSKQ